MNDVPERPVQPRLFPAPKPLVERLGVEFFRRVPQAPGVYLMTGEHERLLYVGKAGCLRDRLNSYRHLRPERASRKVIRLIHEVRAITWELCASPEAALLRENELLRRLKPRYNVLNARPEQYCFLGVRVVDGELQLRLTRRPGPLPGETLHGAFKALGRVQAGLAALVRLLWAAEQRPTSLHQFPRRLLGEPSPECPPWTWSGPDAGRWADGLRAWLDGRDDTVLERLMTPAGGEVPTSAMGPFRGHEASGQGVDPLPAGGFEPTHPPSLKGYGVASVGGHEVGVDGKGAVDLSRLRLHELDCERLRHFHQFGPARNRVLRERRGDEGPWIAQDELDDLLVLERRPPCRGG